MGGPSPPPPLYKIKLLDFFLPFTKAHCYLHALLFLHTQQVIKRQIAKVEDEGDEDDEDDGIDIEDEE